MCSRSLGGHPHKNTFCGVGITQYCFVLSQYKTKQRVPASKNYYLTAPMLRLGKSNVVLIVHVNIEYLSTVFKRH